MRDRKTKRKIRVLKDDGVLCTNALLNKHDPEALDAKKIFFECNTDGTVVIKINLEKLEYII